MKPKAIEIDFHQTTAAEIQNLEKDLQEYLKSNPNNGMGFLYKDLVEHLRAKRHRAELVRKYCQEWLQVTASQKRVAVNKSIFSACD